jgi:hypothetical protein
MLISRLPESNCSRSDNIKPIVISGSLNPQYVKDGRCRLGSIGSVLIARRKRFGQIHLTASTPLGGSFGMTGIRSKRLSVFVVSDTLQHAGSGSYMVR